MQFPLLAAVMDWVEKGVAPQVLVASHVVEEPRGPILGVPGNATGGPMLPPPAAGGAGAPVGMGGAPLPPLPAGAGDGPKPPMMMGPDPNAPVKIDRTRPVYPYPYIAKYKGTGSIDDASNFVQGDAVPVPAERLEWLGAGYLTPHYEQWCEGKGQSLQCSDKK